VRARHRVRLAVNLANGSTLAGLGIALAGRARLARASDGLLAGTGYKLPVPAVPAFTVGSVIVTRRDSLSPDTALFRHEARHTTQYAWCGGLLMLPLYFAAAGVSWVLCGDFGAWNVFERHAGLADGGYADHQLRPALGSPRLRQGGRPGPGHASETTPPAAVHGDRDPGPGQGAPAGSSATPSP
jgi:hypothetical protein